MWCVIWQEHPEQPCFPTIKWLLIRRAPSSGRIHHWRPGDETATPSRQKKGRFNGCLKFATTPFSHHLYYNVVLIKMCLNDVFLLGYFWIFNDVSMTKWCAALFVISDTLLSNISITMCSGFKNNRNNAFSENLIRYFRQRQPRRVNIASSILLRLPHLKRPA